MRFTKKTLTTFVACAALAATSLTASAATILKLSHNQDKDHPVHKSMQYMANKVKEYSHGEVIIRIYPNGQLGTQRESMELMQNGALDIVKSNASELESFEPAYGAFNIPYIFHDVDHFYRVINGDVGEKILAASKDKGFIGLTYYDGGARSFYAQKAINSPADLKGMKIRVQPSPTAVEMIKLMGGSATPLSYGELYTALQQGVVDGAENNPTALTNSRHGEVAKFYSLDEHTMIPDVLVIGNKSWAKLTESQQVAVKKAATESMMYHKDLWKTMIDEAIAKAKNDMKVQFVTVEKQPFIDAVKPMHDQALNNGAIAEYVKGIDAEATK
jgi:tripartite ATP-independent transporter DctP family solute receptor